MQNCKQKVAPLSLLQARPFEIITPAKAGTPAPPPTPTETRPGEKG